MVLLSILNCFCCKKLQLKLYSAAENEEAFKNQYNYILVLVIPDSELFKKYIIKWKQAKFQTVISICNLASFFSFKWSANICNC